MDTHLFNKIQRRRRIVNFRQLEDWSSVESIVITSTDLLEFGNRLAIKKMLNSELVKPFKFF